MPPAGTQTKKERREAAREQRRQEELREQAQGRRRRRLQLLGGACAVVAALVATAIAVSSAGGGDDGAAGGGEAIGGREAAALFDGIPQRGTTVGDPDAPLTVIEFADLQCPVCKQFSERYLPAIVRDYVRTGKVKLELRTLAFLGPDSDTAARAAAGAAEQNRLWQFADTFYRNQGTENSGYVTDDFLRKVAGAVPGLDAARVLAADDGGASVAAADQLAARFGVQSTPSFLIARKGEPPRFVEQDYPDLHAAIGRELDRR